MSKESTLNLFRRLEQLNGIGAALSRERDIERLLENILEAAKTITGADGGTLYSVTEDQSALKFEILRTDSLGIRVYAEVKKHFEGMVFESVITRNVRLSEAPSHGKPVLLYDSESKGSTNYMDLAKELIAKNQ